MSAGTQEPLAVARVTAFLDVRDAAPKRPVILGSIRANVIEEREGKVLFSDDLRFLLSVLTKAEQERDEAVKRAEKAEAERDDATAKWHEWRDKHARLDRSRESEVASLYRTITKAEARAAAMEGALEEISGHAPVKTPPDYATSSDTGEAFDDGYSRGVWEMGQIADATIAPQAEAGEG